MRNMNYKEISKLESVTFNIREGVVYLLIVHLVVKTKDQVEEIISSNNERVTLPKGTSLDFLNEIEGSQKAILLIENYWSIL